MSARMTRGEKVFSVCNYIILTLISLTMLYPYIQSLAMSMSDRYEIIRGNVILWPRGFDFSAYQYIFRNNMFWMGLRVTTLITIAGTAFSVFMTCLFAYPLANKNFKLRNGLTVMVIITMFFSGGLIPSFILNKALGLYNNILVYIVPGAISTWSLIILRNFFQQIPQEMEESAYIDGANDLVILVKIIVPIALPSIATITLWYMVGQWNTFSTSIYYTTSKDLRTLQVALRGILLDEESFAQTGNVSDLVKRMTPQALKSAWIMCVTAPILMVYPFLQKYFVKGVIVGALKG